MIKILALSILATLLACEGGSGSSSKGAGSSGGGGGSGGGSRQVTPLVGKILPKLALGDRHSCAVTDDGQALCWGNGTNGQLGNSQSSNKSTPVYVVDGEDSTIPLSRASCKFPEGMNTPVP